MKKFSIFYKHSKSAVEVEAPNFMSLHTFMGYSYSEFWDSVINNFDRILVNGTEVGKFQWHHY